MSLKQEFNELLKSVNLESVNEEYFNTEENSFMVSADDMLSTKMIDTIWQWIEDKLRKSHKCETKSCNNMIYYHEYCPDCERLWEN